MQNLRGRAKSASFGVFLKTLLFLGRSGKSGLMCFKTKEGYRLTIIQAEAASRFGLVQALSFQHTWLQSKISTYALRCLPVNGSSMHRGLLSLKIFNTHPIKTSDANCGKKSGDSIPLFTGTPFATSRLTLFRVSPQLEQVMQHQCGCC